MLTRSVSRFDKPSANGQAATAPRWSVDEIAQLYELPFLDLLYQAQQTHREHHSPNAVQLSSLLSIKTGGCPEDCSYCPQSSRYNTHVEKEKLLQLNEVIAAAQEAKAGGAQRFCMGAAWRGPKAYQLDAVIDMIKAVKGLGLETCVTLGMLKDGQAEQLRDAGLDYYNHNLDTDPDYYGHIITTRQYQDRLDTLERVRSAGINVCCGGIVGLGEDRRHRAGLIAELANLAPYPESVPINNLVRVEGTPLSDNDELDPFEFVRTIAVARITMPKAAVRLSAGREAMSDTMQALCFMAGANSIFYGEKLLTTGNPQYQRDLALFERLGLVPAPQNSNATALAHQAQANAGPEPVEASHRQQVAMPAAASVTPAHHAAHLPTGRPTGAQASTGRVNAP